MTLENFVKWVYTSMIPCMVLYAMQSVDKHLLFLACVIMYLSVFTSCHCVFVCFDFTQDFTKFLKGDDFLFFYILGGCLG